MATVVKSEELREHAVAEGFDVWRIVETETMSIQEWACAPGASFPEHDHVHEQIGYVYAGGELTLTVGEDEFVVGPGDTYVLDANEPHAGTNHTDETVRGVDVFHPPLTDEDWIG